MATEAPEVRVLVVCHANVTRSVAAAFLLSEAGEGADVALEVRSAGTHVLEGQPVSLRTQRALSKAVGTTADLGSHRSRQLVLEDLEWADLVITMEASQVRLIRRMMPLAAPRTATLRVLADEFPRDERPAVDRVASMTLESREPDDHDDVTDPAGGDDPEYEVTMVELLALCRSLAGRIAG